MAIYFLVSGDIVGFEVICVILALALFFNVGVSLDSAFLTIDVCGLRIVSVPVDSIKSIYIPDTAGLLEKYTSGIHFVGNTLVVHAGPANLAFLLNSSRVIKVSVRQPQRFVGAAAYNG